MALPQNNVCLMAFASHSNMLELATKNHIPINELVNYFDRKIYPVEASVDIDNKADEFVSIDFEELKYDIATVLSAKLKNKAEIEYLSMIMLNADKFIRSLSNSIVEQLRVANPSQRLFTLATNSNGNTFHYTEKFCISDTQKPRAEIVKVTGTIKITCEEIIIEQYKFHLEISLNIEAVTALLDFLEHPDKGITLVKALVWNDIQNFFKC